MKASERERERENFYHMSLYSAPSVATLGQRRPMYLVWECLRMQSGGVSNSECEMG